MAAKVKWDRGAWWVVTHHAGKKTRKSVGPTKADRRQAEAAARRINAALELGALGVQTTGEPEAPLPFDQFAEDWLRREVVGPSLAGIGHHLAPGTAESYASHVRIHLKP